MQFGGPVISYEAPPSSGQLQLWGSQIKDAREVAGIPIEAIASSLNLRVSFVNALENGRGNLHMEWSYERQHLRAIANKLGVTLMEEVMC
jgi:cytoskeletal protein RodZ